MSLDKPPKGHPGTSFVIQLKKPDNKVKEETEVERDVFFPTFGSVLVYGALPALESMIADHKKKLSLYNSKLTRNKVPLRIRLTQTATVKGRKYTYCGRYIYGKDGTYYGKLDNVVLRRDHLRDTWDKIGPPPINPLEGLQFTIVVANGKKTTDVLIPFNLFNRDKFNHILKIYTHYRLG